MNLDTVRKSEFPASRYNLDSHFRMVTVERNYKIISNSDRTVDASPFMPDCESTHQVHMVDDTIMHNDEHNEEICILIVRDNISAPAMYHKLTPPFSVRNSGGNVRTVPKFQVEDHSIEDDSTCFSKVNLRSPLKFHGTLSYFLSKKYSIDMLNESE